MSSSTYRNIAVATTLLGVVLTLFGYGMGGFNSVTWAGFIGAGIALMIHGGLATIGSFLFAGRHSRNDFSQ